MIFFVLVVKSKYSLFSIIFIRIKISKLLTTSKLKIKQFIIPDPVTLKSILNEKQNTVICIKPRSTNKRKKSHNWNSFEKSGSYFFFCRYLRLRRQSFFIFLKIYQKTN